MRSLIGSIFVGATNDHMKSAFCQHWAIPASAGLERACFVWQKGSYISNWERDPVFVLIWAQPLSLYLASESLIKTDVLFMYFFCKSCIPLLSLPPVLFSTPVKSLLITSAVCTLPSEGEAGGTKDGAFPVAMPWLWNATLKAHLAPSLLSFKSQMKFLYM